MLKENRKITYFAGEEIFLKPTPVFKLSSVLPVITRELSAAIGHREK